MVCVVNCKDGISIGTVYDNNCTDEPELPPFDATLAKKRWRRLRGLDPPSTSSGDECPSNNMPGAFKD